MGPRAGLQGGKSRPYRDSIPDRPARSSIAVLTELPGQQICINTLVITACVLSLTASRGGKYSNKNFQKEKHVLSLSGKKRYGDFTSTIFFSLLYINPKIPK